MNLNPSDIRKMILIAGPCVIESQECLDTVATTMASICDDLKIDYCFKASFDKANRTSVDAFRGPGFENGMNMLGEIKDRYGLPVATDIHEPWQAEPVAKVTDVIQIPAFLCRQTDLLITAGKTNKIINVKKAQFLAPWDMGNVVKKIETTGNKNIMLCERGTTFGYNRLIVDMSGFHEMKKFGYPLVFDATHSVQQPGGGGNCTSGNSDYVEPLAKAAIAAGANHLFMETHPFPSKALSDGPNMVKLNDMRGLLGRIMRVREAVFDAY